MGNKIYILYKEWSRHGKYSGYQRVVSYMSLKVKWPRVFALPYSLANYLKKKTKLVNYRSETILKELFILFRIFNKKTVFVLYGDMDYYFLHYLKQFPFNLRKNKLIATFHHPPYELEKRLQYNRKEVLGALDKIIVMGPNQIPFLKKYTDADIKFIPHGIDTHFFTPDNRVTRSNSILIFGVSHRDHVRNIAVIKKVNELNLPVTFVIVMPKAESEIYADAKNTEIIYDMIDDEQLLYYYRSCKGVLLSLIDCTASNTILEALSTGCPLIVNRVGAVDNYIPESANIPMFNTGDIEGTARYIKRLIDDAVYLERIAHLQRVLALRYDWKNIVQETKNFIFN
ncbi:glycosyltransferase family 4 protein [Snuella sedimenti]|uniref:Glycosyltransferase family 4 protein n=1 Tax=Snuella sedimenti TaxID=2798802 RepID=A0A8J7LNH1_9FLAO|nr:glycosyltransferase family 4 protein [Snuella sedimenti]MBJ6367903.1 glycosyltransferase family 4 protein [Snuella sedimenti]